MRAMTRLLMSLVLLALVFVALAAGCGSSGKSGFVPVDDSGASPDVVIADDSGAILTGDASTPPDCKSKGTPVTCTTAQCSSDLHTVLDCDGDVIQSCPAEQGCANGGCVAPCDSAIANKSSIGCEYYIVNPEIVFPAAGACFAAFVANTWPTPVRIAVDYDGATLNVSTFAYIPAGSGTATTYTQIQNSEIPAGQVAILFLSNSGSIVPNSNCPPQTAAAITNRDTATHGTGKGKAFHLTATAPVVAYDILPYGGGRSAITSATLLLPTSAWDTNYVAVDAFGPGEGLDQPSIAIVGQKDGTEVVINPASALAGGGGVAAAPKGVPTTYTVDRGQVLQFTQNEALTGSIIQSNHPVGLWGGKSGLAIEGCCGETAHQQIPPVRALGNEYVGVRYRNRYDGREESPPWRLVGAAAGTQLTYEPTTPPGAPAMLELGMVVQFHAAGPFVVRSQDAQHPFYMSAHMTGAQAFDPGNDGRGDAEFVNVIPTDEYLESYVFFADPTYSETNLVLVRAKGPKGFSDVTLDCAGPLTGWQPIDACGRYEYTRTDLVRFNFAKQGNCDNGRHEIKSESPFGLTVWGWGSGATGSFSTQYVSYAYPAGAGVQPINSVVIPPTVR